MSEGRSNPLNNIDGMNIDELKEYNKLIGVVNRVLYGVGVLTTLIAVTGVMMQAVLIGILGSVGAAFVLSILNTSWKIHEDIKVRIVKYSANTRGK